MTIKESIAETIETLSVEEQKVVLDFAEFLKSKKNNSGQKKTKSLEGMWKNVDITAEDIDKARREMWENFSREEGR